MSQARVLLEESFAVPPETLFSVLADFGSMDQWMKAKVSVVAGPPEGALGTTRRLHLPGGLEVDERITYFAPPRRLVYRVVSRAPGLRFHRGEILVEPWGKTGSQLSWDILLESPVPGLARLIAAGLRPAVQEGLTNLRVYLDARAA